jgi:hypothetical protein
MDWVVEMVSGNLGPSVVKRLGQAQREPGRR